MPNSAIDKVMDRRAMQVGSTLASRREWAEGSRYGYKLMTDEEYEALPHLPPHEVCRAQIEDAIEPWLDLCEETWHFRPPLRFTSWGTRKCRVVKVDFNIKGFQHDGKRIYINRRSWTVWRTPSKIAREIIEEISTHRNSCADCGEGIASIHDRVLGRSWIRDLLKGGDTGFTLGYDTRESGEAVQIYLDTEVPPDAVEEKLHPLLSRKLRQRLATPEAQALQSSPARLRVIKQIAKKGRACRMR